jgi:endonuclease I
LIRQPRLTAAALLFFALLAVRLAWADAYDPPAGYYSPATGTGATLKQQLHNIIDGHTGVSYDSLRSALQVSDADPNNPGHILLVYDRVSLNVAAINPGGSIPGWDQGVSWDREHTWPQSRGLDGTSMPDGADMHALRPSTRSVNNSRGNLNFGGEFGAQPYGIVSDNGNQVWYPGDADAGMIARHGFYMAVRYDGGEGGTTNLELTAGDPPTNGTLMGDLNRMIEWHFAAPPDDFERGRNQIIYDEFQENRNPFIDRPELMWSIFVGQANNSRITIAGSTPDAAGGSARDVDLGRVFVGAPLPAAQSFTLDKAGTNGTYFDVTTTGAASSSLSGRFNAFRTNQTDSAAISVGLNTSTATAGLRSGSVTVDNLDITTGGGAGRGANDANDTFNVSLAVLDHATPSFTSDAFDASLTHDFGVVDAASAAPSLDFDVFNLTATPGFTADMDFDDVIVSGDSALTTNLAPAAGSLSLAAGLGQTFTAMLNTAAIGAFSATYTLMFSDEDLPGALSETLTLTLLGEVLLAGDYNRDGIVDAADYLNWRSTFGQHVPAYSGADGDGDGQIGEGDHLVWMHNFGDTSPAAGGGSFSAAVPEPGSIALLIAGLCGLAGIMARPRSQWAARSVR